MDNWIQIFHIILSFIYLLILVTVGKVPDTCQATRYLSAVVVFIAWMDLTFALRSLMFGKLSNLGLYITLLLEVFTIFTSFSSFILNSEWSLLSLFTSIFLNSLVNQN